MTRGRPSRPGGVVEEVIERQQADTCLGNSFEHHDPTIRRYDHRNMGKRDSLPAVGNRRDRVREGIAGGDLEKQIARFRRVMFVAARCSEQQQAENSYASHGEWFGTKVANFSDAARKPFLFFAGRAQGLFDTYI